MNCRAEEVGEVENVALDVRRHAAEGALRTIECDGQPFGEGEERGLLEMGDETELEVVPAEVEL